MTLIDQLSSVSLYTDSGEADIQVKVKLFYQTVPQLYYKIHYSPFHLFTSIILSL